MQITYKLAHAAAWDAANRRAEKAGRSKWNKSDYAFACREFERIYGGTRA